MNYGLRDGADEDEEFVRGAVRAAGRAAGRGAGRARRGAGNLQERARDARYALAERLAEGDYAAAHTASDQAETVLYRLAVSPGLAGAARDGAAPRAAGAAAARA